MSILGLNLDQSLGDALAQMENMGAGMMRCAFNDGEGRVVAAFVLIRGEETQRYIDALDRTENEIEEEQDEDHAN